MNTITVNINRVDLDVTFSYCPCHPAFSDTADGVEIEIECISLDGKTVDSLLAAHVVEKVYQKVRAAKNRIRWGEYAELRYIERRSVPYRMYILAVVNELTREARIKESS